MLKIANYQNYKMYCDPKVKNKQKLQEMADC